MRWAAALAAACGSVALAGNGVAAAPAAVPGAQYDGHNGTHGDFELRVARGGGRLTVFSFFFSHGRCSDGGRYNDGGAIVIKRGARINSLGHASYSRTFGRAFTFTKRGRRVNGHEQFSIAMQFAGDRAEGVLHDHFWSSGYRCASGAVGFVAYRDGTPGALLRDFLVATGWYHGRVAGSARQPISMRVFLPWARVMSLDMHWLLHCPRGRAFREHTKVSFMPFEDSGSVASYRDAHAGSFTVRGIRAVWSFALTGTFSNPGRYVTAGHWSYRVSYYRSGAYLGSCGDSAGFLAPGPAG